MNKSSRRIRRMERHHALAKGSPLNLVSLMDIFTILVFFLLVNSSSSVQLPNLKDLILPNSTAKKVPKETPVLIITPDNILLQNQVVMTFEALRQSDPTLPELQAALRAYTQKKAINALDNREPPHYAITIMGDENIAFEQLNKILTSCQQANFTDIAFAATQTAADALE